MSANQKRPYEPVPGRVDASTEPRELTRAELAKIEHDFDVQLVLDIDRVKRTGKQTFNVSVSAAHIARIISEGRYFSEAELRTALRKIFEFSY